jgi:hypothetical protein
MIKDRTGEIYTFEDGRTVEIIEYFSARNITIKFNDGVVLNKIQYGNFNIGNIRNFNMPNVFGIGFLGYGKYVSFKNNKCYQTWTSLMARSYSDYVHSRRPTYIGCSVHPDWHNFQVFAEWYYKNYKEGFHLDKDILIKGNKVYSEKTCCFVPKEINGLFTTRKLDRGRFLIGVSKRRNSYFASVNINGNRAFLGDFHNETEAFNAYKIAKEKGIKFVANKFRDQITPECYNALINWTIDIND